MLPQSGSQAEISFMTCNENIFVLLCGGVRTAAMNFTLSKGIFLLVLVTTGASVCLHLGYSLQKKGVQKLNDIQFGIGTLLIYFKTRPWVLGILSSAAGTALIILALRMAPVSTVQPLLGCGLIFLVLFSRFYLKEHISGIDYAALFLVVSGVVFLGLSTSETDITKAYYEPRRFFGYIALVILIVTAVLMLLSAIFGLKEKDIRFGILSGIFYAFASLFLKAMFNGMQEYPESNFYWFIPLSIASVLLGLSFIQKGFSHGRAVIVIIFNDITNQLTVISGGLFCFKESLPSEPLLLTLKLSAFAMIIIGSMILSRLGQLKQSVPQ